MSDDFVWFVIMVYKASLATSTLWASFSLCLVSRHRVAENEKNVQESTLWITKHGTNTSAHQSQERDWKSELGAPWEHRESSDYFCLGLQQSFRDNGAFRWLPSTMTSGFSPVRFQFTYHLLWEEAPCLNQTSIFNLPSHVILPAGVHRAFITLSNYLMTLLIHLLFPLCPH